MFFRFVYEIEYRMYVFVHVTDKYICLYLWDINLSETVFPQTYFHLSHSVKKNSTYKTGISDHFQKYKDVFTNKISKRKQYIL